MRNPHFLLYQALLDELKTQEPKNLNRNLSKNRFSFTKLIGNTLIPFGYSIVDYVPHGHYFVLECNDGTNYSHTHLEHDKDADLYITKQHSNNFQLYVIPFFPTQFIFHHDYQIINQCKHIITPLSIHYVPATWHTWTCYSIKVLNQSN